MTSNTTSYSRLLTQRWFTFPEQVERHPVIQRYRHEPVRFKTVHAGRRSFKTEIAKRTLVAECIGNRKQSLFFGAPTRDQAKRIAWNDIKQLSPPYTIAAYSDGELWIRYKTGSELWVIGFDAAERFDGKSQWHGGILDEYADMRPDVWSEHVEPALRDTRGWCWFIGVPEGKNHYYELVEYARSGENSHWADYCWFSSEVMHPDEISEVKSRLDTRTYRQEYEGSFESYEGRVYCYFSSDIHRIVRPLDWGVPLFVACDFNVNPCVWEIGQDTDDFTYVYDELRQGNTDIFKMCAALKRRLVELMSKNEHRARMYPIRFYGDYSGMGRNFNATLSSWEIIKQEFAGWNVEYRLQHNPNIIDRVNAVNARMRSATGNVSFGCNPKCVELIRDFDMCEMDDLQQKKSQAGDRTHASDALGYMLHYEHPVLPKVRGEQYVW
ncbi:MAG: hypothetical protein EPO24_11105 [Bacteroidetes bacterium]|nr:MAG: hypothetical protein EPO24_11105 [Bacteroidota bacterium]